jgi:hypothetical protein
VSVARLFAAAAGVVATRIVVHVILRKPPPPPPKYAISKVDEEAFFDFAEREWQRWEATQPPRN